MVIASSWLPLSSAGTIVIRVVDLLEPVGRDDPREEETFALAEAWGLGFRWEGTSFLDRTRRS
jgi:hypothetical protein